MSSDEILAFLSTVASQKEDERFFLRYGWKELLFDDSIEEIALRYYYPTNPTVVKSNQALLRESIELWLSNSLLPTDLQHTKSSESVYEVTTLLNLLDNFFQHYPYFVFEIQLPFDIEGAFSEHFLLTDGVHLYLLEFVIG